jgi:hypothetical protein
VYELVFYYGGTAILTKAGEVQWTSDADEEFAAEFDTVTVDDADDVLEYLEDLDYIPEGEECEVVDDDEGPDDEPDEDEDEDEDELHA